LSPAIAADPPPAFRIAGYLPEYRFAKFDPAHAAPLTDLILFAAEPTADGQLDMTRFKDAPWRALKEFKTRQRIRLNLCVGGWGRSSQFPAVAADLVLRRRFAQSALDILLAQRLDGLDLDWEHPEGDAQQQAYADLLGELHAAFLPHGLQLSLTMAPWQRLPPSAYEAADWVQLMSYDYGGRHATLDQATRDVDEFLRRGVPAEKIILGLPFYGRHMQQREQSLAFAEIARRHVLPAEADEADGVFFNGPETIRRKTRLALSRNLGGVMIWEIGQDARDDRSLLRTIADEVRRGR
jgi:GH18 family chitinase